MIFMAEIGKVITKECNLSTRMCLSNMIANIQIALSTLIFIALGFSVFYSYRFRRETDPKRGGLLSSKMNIAMGIMLIIISITQLFFFEDSVIRRIFGTVCLLLGLFNFYVGLRNYFHFKR